MEQNIVDIYNILFAGKKLRMEFDNAREAEIFRVKLAQYKGRQDKLMAGLGVIDDSARQVFSFSIQQLLALAPEDAELPLPEVERLTVPVAVTLQFKEKDIARRYKITILDDEDQEQDLSQ